MCRAQGAVISLCLVDGLEVVVRIVVRVYFVLTKDDEQGVYSSAGYTTRGNTAWPAGSSKQTHMILLSDGQ